MTTSSRLDRWVLHPTFSVPLFLLVMYLLFVFAVGVGGIFQDGFEQLTQAAVQAILGFLPNRLVAGVSHGVGLTASFIPVLLGLFLGLGILEQSGYMARVARIAEGLTRWIGLPGKAFVPLLIGFGCNVPAIMGTRILHNERDRTLTIMMLPFMSCGARLAIYALFVSVFFAESGYRCIFILYLVGILFAVFTAMIFKHAWFRSKVQNGAATADNITALPPYRWPAWRSIWRQSVARVKRFVFKAGVVIVPCCLVLGSLNDIKTFTGVDIEWLGRQATPIFRPMGIEEDNWPATVGLITGLAAKEVLVGTLGGLYQAGEIATAEESIPLMDATQKALLSVVDNAQVFACRLWQPLDLEAGADVMKPETQRMMASKFESKIAAFAYLLFVLLYFPCISVVVMIAKELNRYWAALSIVWSTGLAYVVAVVFYQSFQLTGPFAIDALFKISLAFGLLGSMIAGIYLCGWMLRQRDNGQNSRMIAVKTIV